MNQNKFLAIILAAGKGTRMKEDIPKPLVPVYGRPILSWIVDSFKDNDIETSIIINPRFKKAFNNYGKASQFIYQKEQLGTGHAVLQASNIIKSYDHVFVFVGDSPFISKDLILQMLNQHISKNNDATILTSIFNEKLFPYARVIRNSSGDINKIIEEIDADNQEVKVNELFGSHYLFKSEALHNYLPKLKSNTKTGEIYFTDILNELIIRGKKIESIVIDDWKKIVGLNTKKDIEWAESQKMI